MEEKIVEIETGKGDYVRISIHIENVWQNVSIETKTGNQRETRYDRELREHGPKVKTITINKGAKTTMRIKMTSSEKTIREEKEMFALATYNIDGEGGLEHLTITVVSRNITEEV